MTHMLKGAWVAALTPLNKDLSADLPAMIAHYRWLLANGCDGIACLGTTGEAIGMKTFGASAPLKELQKKFGFTVDHVVEAARNQLAPAL